MRPVPYIDINSVLMNLELFLVSDGKEVPLITEKNILKIKFYTDCQLQTFRTISRTK